MDKLSMQQPSLKALTALCAGATIARSTMADTANGIYEILLPIVNPVTIANLEKSKSSIDAKILCKELLGNRTEKVISAMDLGYCKGYASKGGKKLSKLIGVNSFGVWTDDVSKFAKGGETMQLGSVECWKYVTNDGIKIVNLTSKKSLKENPSNKTLKAFVEPVHKKTDASIRRSRQWCATAMLEVIKEHFDVTPEPPAEWQERFTEVINKASKVQLGTANKVSHEETYAEDTREAMNMAWATLKKLASKTK